MELLTEEDDMPKTDTISGRSDLVRSIVIRDYIEPARTTRQRIQIRQGDLKDKMAKHGFPVRNANQIGTSIEADKFWKAQGLRMLSPKGQSRANDTVYEFEFLEQPVEKTHSSVDDADARAERFVRGLKGLLKEELKEYGGAEGFMRWIRSEDVA